jgi:copper chaperone CopZ
MCGTPLKYIRDKQTAKRIAAFACLLCFALTACGVSGEPPVANNDPAPTDNIAESTAEQSTGSATEPITTELTVWGMVCTRCENKVINALSAVDGVVSVTADNKADTVTVVHEPWLSVDALNNAITGEGFNVP